MRGDECMFRASSQSLNQATAALSVVLVPPHALDIVPCVGLVAKEALRYVGVLHFRDALRDHIEMHHVVARRCRVALVAIG